MTIAGTARPGRTLSCAIHGYRPEPGARIEYSWSIVGTGRGGVSSPAQVASGRRYVVRKRDRGHRVACFVDATNAGGYVHAAVANRVIPRFI